MSGGEAEGEGGREAFLARWSRRKREARGEKHATGAAAPSAAATPAPPAADGAPAPQAPLAPGAGEAPAAGGRGEPAAAPAPEPPPLPDISTLTAESDLRPFMRAGVPQALRRAALARLWSLDPAIRDFREMADYDWDFNAAGGAPGFGPLQATPEQIERWLARILPPEPEPEDAGAGAVAMTGAEAAHPPPLPAAAQAEPPAAGGLLPAGRQAPESGTAQADAPPALPPEPDPPRLRPRRHGSAVPV